MIHSNTASPVLPRSLPPFAAMAYSVAATVLKWEQHLATRRSLARLDPHQLDDIGISVASARKECAKPFWRD